QIKSIYPYNELVNELAKFQPQECLINPSIENDKILHKKLKDILSMYITVKDEEFFNADLLQFSTKFKSKLFKPILNKKFALKASKACLNYLNETQKLSLYHIDNINF